MHHKLWRMGPLASAIAISQVIATFARAQDLPQAVADPDGQFERLEDIVVTAEKRSTSLQKTPIAVTALDGDRLKEAQLTDLRNFTSVVPSFKASDQGGFGQITIRGIGIQNFTPLAESAVAVNLNQVYLSRPSSFLSSIYDVQSIEVLRGPQGTLYGRNATAGSINITTRRPDDELSGNVAITVGNYDQIRVEAGVGGSLVDGVVRARIAGFTEHRGGYGTNFSTGQDVNTKQAQGVRATFVVTPTEALTGTFIAEHYHENSSHGQYLFGSAGLLPLPGAIGRPAYFESFGAPHTLNSYDVYNNRQNYYRLNTTTLTGILEYDLGDITLRSISGYRKQKLSVGTDIDGSGSDIGFFYSGEPAEQFSQELQILYNSGPLNLAGGLFYFDEKDSARPSVAAFSPRAVDLTVASLGITLPPRTHSLTNLANIGGDIDTESMAAFTEGSVEITSGVKLIAGIRFSRDRKRLTSRYLLDFFTPFDPSLLPAPEIAVPARTFKSTTPKLGIQYQATPSTMLYATYSKGFKSGSFDAGANPATTPSLSFAPEKLTSYEVGVKTMLLDNRLRANLAVFRYDYTDLQVSQAIGLGVVTQNAGEARVYGLEGEFTFIPVDGFELSVVGSYLDTKYLSYFGADGAQPRLPIVDFSGNRLNNAPKWSSVASAQYTTSVGAGEISIRGESELSTRVYFTSGNYDLVSQEGHAKYNAFLTYRHDDGVRLTAFARNISNEVTRIGGSIQSPFLGNSIQGSLAPPRTYGLTFAYDF